MLIGFDGSRAFVKNRTGTENYSYQLLVNLAKVDHENEYIVYLRPENLECHPELVSLQHSVGGRVGSRSGMTNEWPENFKFKVLNFKRLWTQIGLALQTFKDPLDILFTPAHTLPLIRRPGLKTVMTVHDLGAEYLPGLHQLKQRLYLGFITKFQLKTATKLIAVSKATKEDLIKKVGVDEKKVEVVYEALVKNDVEVDILKQFDIEKDRYFLFVGTIQPRKNLSRLIEAFNKLGNQLTRESANQGRQSSSQLVSWSASQLKLVLAGGKGWMSDEIYELPKRLGIEDRVKFLGRVDDKYLPELYKNAVGFTYPSLFEGFGLPILEAFSNNCPVLTSNISSMPEVAGKAGILVDPYSVDSISNGLKLLLDAKHREKQVKLGREQLKKFSWEKAALQTLEVFEKVKSKE